MTKREWTIIGALVVAVVVVFCFGGLWVFFTLVPSQTQVVVVEVTATPIPSNANALRATSTPQLIRPPAPTDTPKPAPKNDADIFVKEHSCISNNGYVWCLVVLYNPTDSMADLGFSADVFDTGGVSIGSVSGSAQALFPKETRKTMEGLSLPGNSAFGKYTFSVYRSIFHGGAGISQNPFTVSGVEIQSGDAAAVIGNSSNKSFNSVQVDSIFYDRNGKFVGGDQTWTPVLPAGGKARVRISLYESWGEVSRVEVYPSIGLITNVQ